MEKQLHGTWGEFEIILKSNYKLKYVVSIKSQNKKPQNLVFYIKGKDKKYDNLEELGKKLHGEIFKEEKIIVKWEWEYENVNNEEKNVQDTIDGETLNSYKFTICVIGHE